MSGQDFVAKPTAKEALLMQKLQDLNAQLEMLRSHRVWKCAHCEKKTRICDLKLVVYKFYVRPSGCTGGDYWTEGEDPRFAIVCPKCNKETTENQYSPERYSFVRTYRSYFGEHESRKSDF